jgi:hypothetical protein
VYPKPGKKEKKAPYQPLPKVRNVPEVSHLPCIKCGIKGHSQWAHMSSSEKTRYGGGTAEKCDDRVGGILCDEFGNGCHKKMDTPPPKELHDQWVIDWYRIMTDSWLLIWEDSQK